MGPLSQNMPVFITILLPQSVDLYKPFRLPMCFIVPVFIATGKSLGALENEHTCICTHVHGIFLYTGGHSSLSVAKLGLICSNLVVSLLNQDFWAYCLATIF